MVAVKILHPGYADDDAFAARFVREARSAARLSHPHVVGVFDQGEDDGTLFLAMEYVPGRTLRDVIRDQGPLPPAQALALLEPVMSARAAAPHAGVVHPDVKPPPGGRADPGRVKVADFGLVRAVTSGTNTATSGVLIGTVSYVAPELVTDGVADTRSDVYSAGVLLYELLTGRKPHLGETPIQVAYKHVHEDVPPPSERVPGLPAYVDALVARATARQRDARPADAKVFLHQLRRVRHAIHHGVTEDAELVEDLSPSRRDDGTEPTLRVEGLLPAHGDAEGPVEPPEGRPSPGPEPPADDDGSQPRRSRKRMWGWIGLVVVLLLAAAAGAGGWYYSVGRYTTTPDLTGLTMTQARTQLRSTDLHMQTAPPAYSETVPEGDIISTDPDPGSRIIRGGTLTAVVSKGKERYPMPDVVGASEAEARTALTDTQLAVGEVRHRYSEKVAEGLVISASEQKDTPLPPGEDVDLVVSKGPEPIDVPDVAGMARSDAKQTLRDLGLRVRMSRTFDNSVPRGQVISQDPSSSRTLFRGDRVQLLVSKGPELVQVPSVFGRHQDDAIAALEGAGFAVDVQQASGYVGFDLVSAQNPSGSDLAPLGSTVTIYLY